MHPEDFPMENFGASFRKTRRHHKMRLGRVARALGVGEATLGKIERGEERTSPDEQLWMVEILQQLVIHRRAWCIPRNLRETDLERY